VFPKLLVCLDCGSSSFMTPTGEVARLAEAGASTATEKPARTDCPNSR
jgi:hypothetical protein